MASPPKISKQVIPENREMDDYFMAIAFLTAQRGSDRAVEAGAVVVNEDNCIMATGYSDLHKCSSGSKYPKELFVAHAEASAILSANCASLKNNRIYVTRFPDNESAKLIVQSGISKVLYASHDKEGEQYIASGKMLRSANIECEQYVPKEEKIDIDFVPVVAD